MNYHHQSRFNRFITRCTVSVITSHRSTRSEWQNVFFLTAADYAAGAVIFVSVGSGNRQRLADDATPLSSAFHSIGINNI